MDKSDLNELKNMLSGLEDSIMAKVDEKLDKLTTKHEQKTEKKKKYRRRTQKEKQVTSNTFNVDDLGLTTAEQKELAQASKSDRKNNVHIQRERLTSRRPSGRIEVRCRSCGKTEKVSPALVIKDEDGFRYKCNKCSCSPG